MTGPASWNELVDAMIKSGEKAVRDFRLISGGEWFDEAPEYFLSTYIARSVGNYKKKTFALLEVSVKETRKYAGASGDEREEAHERRNGRFDVVLYWANGNPRAVLEIKSPVWSATEQKIYPDIDRLGATLMANSNSTLQFGVFLFYASVREPDRKHDNATQRMRDLLTRVEEKAIERADKLGVEVALRHGSVHKRDGDAWSIATLVFTRGS